MNTLARRSAAALVLAAAIYVLFVRRRIVRWGATDDELARPYPGADLVPGGTRASTMAVTIDAPPTEVWPWLIQMGGDRAGWYSWDHLDNGGHSSARQLHPEWQNLALGDHIAAWSPTGLIADAWEVVALEPGRFLGLRGRSELRSRTTRSGSSRPAAYTEGLWGFLLEEVDTGRTRLLVGGYQVMRPRWLERIVDFWVYPPVHWVMQARQLHNLKRNIEGAHASKQ